LARRREGSEREAGAGGKQRRWGSRESIARGKDTALRPDTRKKKGEIESRKRARAAALRGGSKGRGGIEEAAAFCVGDAQGVARKNTHDKNINLSWG